MTSLETGTLTGDSVWAAVAEIYEQVSGTLNVSPDLLFLVLDNARDPGNEREVLGAAQILLTAAVALAELMRIAPSPGNDFDALLQLGVDYLSSERPEEVAQGWLARLQP